jgi:prepilin-type N-terminal cleavage/methylation domain-containing protein
MLQHRNNPGIPGDRCAGRKHGFTLIELLLSAVLGGMLLSTVAFVFASMAGSFAERPTTGVKFDVNFDVGSGNGYIPYSPAYSQLPAAFGLQAAIMHEMSAKDDADSANALESAANIYVLSSDDGTLPSTSFAPTTFKWSNLTAREVSSSAQFRKILDDATADPDSASVGWNATYIAGYSIFFVKEDSSGVTVDMVVHVRRLNPDEASTTSVYKVWTYTYNPTSKSVEFAPELSYAFGVNYGNQKEADISSIFPSVHRISLRTNTDWAVDEELGAQVIFPDPTVLPYQISSTDAAKARTFSRFAIFLPVNP